MGKWLCIRVFLFLVRGVEYCLKMKFDYDCEVRVVEGDDLLLGDYVWILV